MNLALSHSNLFVFNDVCDISHIPKPDLSIVKAWSLVWKKTGHLRNMP